MQQLHLVGFTTDLEGLIFSARKGAKSGGYLVLLDEKLRATVEDALRLRNGPTTNDDDESGGSARPRRPRPESTLSPREIQARLRSGSTIAEVARDAGVDEEWVSRFAVPIQAEQAQVVGRARRLAFVKSRLGASALPLGTAVRWNLADKGILLFDDDYEAAWSAYNLQGASWVVRFEYTSRQKRQHAEWEVDLREGELFARNRTASELGYVDAARRRRRPPALEPSPRETPARASADQPRVAAPRREEEEAPVAPRPAARRGPDAGTRGRGAPASRRRGAAKKPAAPAKVRKAGAAKKVAKKAGKSGKATASRKAASTKRGRPQKPAGKKRGSADRLGAAPKTAALPPPAPLDEPVRPSHLARPPSPIPSARRATTQPLHTPRPVLPRPTPPPVRRPPPPPEPEPEPVVASEPEPEPVRMAPRRPAVVAEPTPRVVGEGVRVLGRPEKANGHGRTAAASQAPRRPPPAAEEEVSAVSPERKLARRLASPPPANAGGGRTRRAVAPGAEAESEPMWHGPGSGEPAPTVRIRADLAAGTRRRTEAEAAPAPAAPQPARTRRQRPLRPQ